MTFNNGLNEQQQYNLIYLMEESGEVVQACSKVLRFGLETNRRNKDQTNQELLEEELGDMLFLVERLIDLGVVNKACIEANKKKKAKKLEIWAPKSQVLEAN